MASDQSMPPSEAPTPKPTPAGPADDMAMMPDSGMPTDGGSVMMQMPKEAFDTIHQLVIQLAGALDQAAQKVNNQAQDMSSAPQVSAATPAPEMGGAAPSSDEQDLAMFAQELNNRGR